MVGIANEIADPQMGYVFSAKTEARSDKVTNSDLIATNSFFKSQIL